MHWGPGGSFQQGFALVSPVFVRPLVLKWFGPFFFWSYCPSVSVLPRWGPYFASFSGEKTIPTWGLWNVLVQYINTFNFNKYILVNYRTSGVILSYCPNDPKAWSISERCTPKFLNRSSSAVCRVTFSVATPCTERIIIYAPHYIARGVHRCKYRFSDGTVYDRGLQTL